MSNNAKYLSMYNPNFQITDSKLKFQFQDRSTEIVDVNSDRFQEEEKQRITIHFLEWGNMFLNPAIDTKVETFGRSNDVRIII